MLGTVARDSAGNDFAAFGNEMPQRVVILICYIKVTVRAEAADFTLGIEWFLFLGSPFYQLDLLPMTVCSNALNGLVVSLQRYCASAVVAAASTASAGAAGASASSATAGMTVAPSMTPGVKSLSVFIIV